ncbi:MAG: dynamin family protein [Actinomycetota bacterium]|nr:dynamin family protein [Actinomycetota bacterium]
MARQLASAASNHPDLAGQAVGVAERLESKQFHILVLGEFKRGKSTLVNALVGHPVLPTGVLPLTAVATEVHFGVEETTVVHTDGSRRAIEREELATYVTEAANPGNRLGVEHVEVGVEEVFPVPGVVLVDTPGVGSVHAHNTAQALAALEPPKLPTVAWINDPNEEVTQKAS